MTIQSLLTSVLFNREQRKMPRSTVIESGRLAIIVLHREHETPHGLMLPGRPYDVVKWEYHQFEDPQFVSLYVTFPKGHETWLNPDWLTLNER